MKVFLIVMWLGSDMLGPVKMTNETGPIVAPEVYQGGSMEFCKDVLAEMPKDTVVGHGSHKLKIVSARCVARGEI